MISSETMMVMIVLMLLSCSVTSVDPESGGTVQRLISQQSSLIQPGLSFINSSNLAGISRVTLEDINNATVSTSQISCTINVVNWSRWLLGYPVYYFKYGHFKNGYHEREVFPSHSEVVVMVNDEESKFTGTSGTIAWELEEENVHLIVMWSIPYNLRIYNSYFGIGVVQLRTRFTRDMLPYWYKQMIENDQGRNFQRGMPGDSLVYKHEKFFIMGHFDNGYHPTINISVMPWQTKDLSPSIWHKLYVDSLRTTAAAFNRSSREAVSSVVTPLLMLLLSVSVNGSVR